MQSKQTPMSANTILTWAGAAGVVAFVIFMLLFGFGFWGALFLGIIVAAVVYVILLMRSDSGSDQASRDTASGGPAAPAPASPSAPAASAAPAVSTAPAPKPAAPAPKPAAPAPKPAAKAGAGGVDHDGDGKVEGTSEGTKPATLTAARGGKADDLKKIKGIGPKMEQLCNKLGFYHYDQIAAWTPDEVAWVDANLEGFKGRVTRDTWVEQAKLLATGGETAFSKKVDKGGVY